VVRKAFTLIELIFAITVIAISVMSLPMMTQVTSKGIEGNIVQEVIFTTQAVLDESTTFYWDASSMEDISLDGYSRVVNTGDCNATTNKRIGHINRSCILSNNGPLNDNNPSALQQVAGAYNNTPILTGSKGQATYKDSYSATATVTACNIGTCVQFGNEANNADLKEISIGIKKTGAAKNLVVLKAYSANIGEVLIRSRIF